MRVIIVCACEQANRTTRGDLRRAARVRSRGHGAGAARQARGRRARDRLPEPPAPRGRRRRRHAAPGQRRGRLPHLRRRAPSPSHLPRVRPRGAGARLPPRRLGPRGRRRARLLAGRAPRGAAGPLRRLFLPQIATIEYPSRLKLCAKAADEGCAMRMARAFMASVPLAVVVVAALVVPLAVIPGTFGFDSWPSSRGERVSERQVRLAPPKVDVVAVRPRRAVPGGPPVLASTAPLRGPPLWPVARPPRRTAVVHVHSPKPDPPPQPSHQPQ